MLNNDWTEVRTAALRTTVRRAALRKGEERQHRAHSEVRRWKAHALQRSTILVPAGHCRSYAPGWGVVRGGKRTRCRWASTGVPGLCRRWLCVWQGGCNYEWRQRRRFIALWGGYYGARQLSYSIGRGQTLGSILWADLIGARRITGVGTSSVSGTEPVTSFRGNPVLLNITK